MSDLTLDEQQNAMKLEKAKRNAIPVCNVVELVTSVVIRIAGKDIADSVGKESLNRGILSNMVANEIKEKVLG